MVSRMRGAALAFLAFARMTRRGGKDDEVGRKDDEKESVGGETRGNAIGFCCA